MYLICIIFHMNDAPFVGPIANAPKTRAFRGLAAVHLSWEKKHSMAIRKRDQWVHVQLSQEEKDMLRHLAERDGLTLADVLRLCIRRVFAGMSV